MATRLATNSDQADPGEFAKSVQQSVADGVALEVRVGDSTCVVSGELAMSLVRVLDLFGSGQVFEINSLPRTISTGQAADLLGVSRPTVIKLIDSGELPATRLGTHRRLETIDVLAFRDQAATIRSESLDEVVKLSRELGLYDE